MMSDNQAAKRDKLWEICSAYVKDMRISCPETVYQSDRVIEGAYELIEKMCDIVGYVDE